jgi:O-antigen/teichoic acid export membrane protein
MTRGQSFRKGVAWLTVGNTGGQILHFLFGIVLARLLAPEDFGVLVTIQVFTGLAGFIAGGGMGQALIRAKTTSRADYDIVFTLQILIGSLIYAGFFVAAPWFARWYDQPLYADLLRVSALSFIFRPFVNLPASILHREMRYKATTGVRLASMAIGSSVSIGMAWMGYGVWSLVIGGIASALANMALFIPLSHWRPGFSLNLRRGRDIARYGMLVSITDILVYLRNQASVFILSRTLGPASVGLYNKGESLARMPHTFITGSVYQVLFRAMAAEQDNLDKCRYLFYRSVALVGVYATPLYVGFAWLAEPLIRGVYGEKWIAAAAPLAILTAAWPFWLVNKLSGAVLAARNWIHREVMVQASSLAVTGLAVVIGLPYGIEGVAWAIVATAVFSTLYIHALAVQCLHARWRSALGALWPAAVLNLALVAALTTLDQLLPAAVRASDLAYLAAMGGGGGLVYALCFLYLPMASLQTEQHRWKTRLRLARLPA